MSRTTFHTLQFERDAESSGVDVSISDKAVLLFNQALIHMRVGKSTPLCSLAE